MRHDRRTEIFVVFGLIMLAALMMVGNVALMRAAILRNRGIDIAPVLGAIAVWLLVSAIGLLRVSRWGAVTLCLPMAALWTFLTAQALYAGERTAVFIWIGFAPIFLTPAYVAVRRWRLLRRW